MIDIQIDNGFLFVSCPYNSTILSFMRSRPQRYWDKQKRIWRIPEADLELFLPVIKDMEYQITYKDAKQAVVGVIPDNYKFVLEPFPYQKEGIEYGLGHNNYLLADEPGLGKTKQILDIACIRKQTSNLKHILIVVCSNGLKYNWEQEVLKHTTEKPYILGTRYTKRGKKYIGSNDDRLADIKSLGDNKDIDDCFVLITNIETLRYKKVEKVPKKRKVHGVVQFKNVTHYPIVEALQAQVDAGQINMIAVDEIHLCKNSASQQGQALLEIDAQYKVAMTGTPIMNRPNDLYLLLKWLGYESHSYYEFERHYCIKGPFHNIIGYKNLPEIQSTLDKCMIRRLKNEVLNLPPKIYINDYVEMTKEQVELYEAVLNDEPDKLDKIEFNTNPLTKPIRLRQITGNPQIVSSKAKSNPKFDRLLELVEEVAQNNSKCVVFSNWTEVIIPAYELLQEKGYQPALYTGQNTKTREDDKQRFSTDEKCKVLLGTIGSIGVGFTLNEAGTIIFLDEPWSRATKNQCEDRAYRIGTVNSPNVITIMCKGTVDERINEIVYRKGKMADIIIDREEDIKKHPEVLEYLLQPIQ